MATPLGDWVLALDGSTLPDKALIGGKAWSIARMGALGLRVPPAFVITTRACAHYLHEGSEPASLAQEIAAGIAWLEQQTGRRFGAGPNPLLVSVRSGAPISMPGMMDTVLNLGITDETEALLAEECGDPGFARDTHRRFLDLYAHIVLKSETALATDGRPADWRNAIASDAGESVPGRVEEQLARAVHAVFESWNSRRARRYREHHDIPHDLGTAVAVQAMVFGNMDENSGTGVLFSRNPLSGAPTPYGEYLARAQGEDIVSGKHTPQPLEALRTHMPHVHEELLTAARLLEDAGGDVQDIEFTLEKGTLYLLQTRAAKRAPRAAVKIAVDMVAEGRIDPSEALARVSSEQVRTLLSPQLANGAALGAEIAARGEAASPGIGTGAVVLDSDEAERRAANGEAVVLARATTSPNDLHGMIAARAILTEQGGSTSHAAVVGRALGRPCVVGCGAGSLDALAGETVTVDGQNGIVYRGALEVVTPHENDDAALRQIAAWAAHQSPVLVTSEPRNGVSVRFDENIEQADALIAALEPGATVEGALFTNDDKAVRAVIAAGAATIVTSPALPALLAAAQAAGRE
ncbi:pyruvate, phosphate dikinase [Sphingosinicella microcystinivorans]|uniref:pyruvate, phosphate dikinase n=1 Tax=Sphingosinicella microcystinivorans TaxID=335406 RepID=UPI0022F3EEF1|nr:pyruvate, phosphate dikinase [Sphingosinicella microcystinivorans]WBX85790.1 pyruvate, phosphate dikinase [Sphingosinicella microcystinivorans]